MDRRPATPEEAKALANPLRLRILRLCLDGPLTNKELAERLGRDPGAVHYHVRTLVRTGFLEEQTPRSSARGALEKPYRATGKSWRIDVGVSEEPGETLSGLEAFREELYEAGLDDVELATRLTMRLNEAALEELEQRLAEILEEFVARDDPDGVRYGAFVGIHRVAGQALARRRPAEGGSAGS